MSKGGLETNIEEVFEAFCNLTQKEMKGVVRKAIGKAEQELKKQTKANLTSSILQRGRSQGKYMDEMEDAVIASRVNGEYGEPLEGKVHILGSRKSGSGTFRARFLEKGTKDRYAKTYKGNPLKKARYLGAVSPKWFFRSANATVLPQVERMYMAEIDKAIQKINNTRI